MIYTLVKKHTTIGETSSSEKFTDYEKCLSTFHKYMSDYIADKTVKECHITILNGDLIPCKSEHFVREVPVEEAETL